MLATFCQHNNPSHHHQDTPINPYDTSSRRQLGLKYSSSMDESDSSTSTPSKRSLVCKTPEPCLVCGVPTSTLHLQVNACYACAAFYRRSINTHGSYRCQKNNQKCDLTIKTIGKPLCRLCRYNKCVEIGMTISRNRDSAAIDFEEDLSDVFLLDMEKSFSKIQRIFERPVMPSLNPSTNLTLQFQELLEVFIETTKPKKSLMIFEDDDGRLHFVQSFFIRSAKMLSKYEPFSTLAINEKIYLQTRFWQLFHLFERCFQACEHFGSDPDDMRMPADSLQFMDISDPSKFLDESANKDSAMVFIQPIMEKHMAFFKMFKKANITVFELAYMSQLALWSPNGLLELSQSTQDLGEKVTGQISNDLHDFYTHRLRLSSYAARQSQLFKLVNFGDLIIRHKQEMLTAKEIFDFGSNSFSYCQFEIHFFDYIKKLRIL